MHFSIWSLPSFLTTLLRSILAFFRSRNRQALVELALRQQLATYAQKGRKPRITPVDWAFWVVLSLLWSRWKDALVIVQSDTVVRWHRKGFRLYWRSISKRGPALVRESSRKWDNCPDLGGPFCPIGHILSMNSRIHPKYKTKYRASNWAEYDRALVQRGDITLWFSPNAGDSWTVCSQYSSVVCEPKSPLTGQATESRVQDSDSISPA